MELKINETRLIEITQNIQIVYSKARYGNIFSYLKTQQEGIIQLPLSHKECKKISDQSFCETGDFPLVNNLASSFSIMALLSFSSYRFTPKLIKYFHTDDDPKSCSMLFSFFTGFFSFILSYIGFSRLNQASLDEIHDVLDNFPCKELASVIDIQVQNIQCEQENCNNPSITIPHDDYPYCINSTEF